MKWFLCALCCLTEGLSVLRAQIMPDSSVQICAYWTPGDKYAYEAREEKFKIDDQGDTTLVYRQSERRVFEILSQTKDRYKIGLTYVSCSPFRVPIARLAAAQAAIKEQGNK